MNGWTSLMKHKIRSLYVITFLVAVGLIVPTSCTINEPKPVDEASAVPAQVSSLFNRCTKCHSGSSAPAGLNFLQDQQQLLSAGLIVAGSAEESLVYQKLEGLEGALEGDRMPKGGPYFTEDELAVIAEWINGITLSPSLVITSPLDGDTVNSSNNSAAFAVTGTCNAKGSNITLSVNGVASSTTVACVDGLFSTTFDSLVIDDSTEIQLQANMANSAGVNFDSEIITLVKDINALNLAITTPSNADGNLRSAESRDVSGTVVGAADKDPTFIDEDNVGAYTISGTCGGVGSENRPVTVYFDGIAQLPAGTCDVSGTWSTTIDTSSLADSQTYKINARITKAVGTSSTTSSNVFVFKNANTTVNFSTVAEIFSKQTTDGSDTNKHACIDCHYQKPHTGTSYVGGSSSLAFGYWNACETWSDGTNKGGRPNWIDPTATSGTINATNCLNANAVIIPRSDSKRSTFKFKHIYANFTGAGSGVTSVSTKMKGGFAVVNDLSDGVALSTANRIVRGNSAQSFIYAKIAGSDISCSHTFGPTNGTPSNPAVGACKSAASAAGVGSNTRMPQLSGARDSGGTQPATGDFNFFSVSETTAIQTWIDEGARMDDR